MEYLVKIKIQHEISLNKEIVSLTTKRVKSTSITELPLN